MKLIQFALFVALFSVLQTAHADTGGANCPFAHGGDAHSLSPAKTQNVVASLTGTPAPQPARPAPAQGNGQGQK